MTRPDDLDRAEERVAIARAQLTQSTEALQSHLQPRALAQSLIDGASEQRRSLIIGAAGLAGVAGAAALVAGLLKRRRARKAADPVAHAKRVLPSIAKPVTAPRVRFRIKRNKK